MKKANEIILTGEAEKIKEAFKNLPEFKSRSRAKKLTGISYLGDVNHSAKSDHGTKYGIYTYIVYLAPSNQSGYNTCKFASVECRASCLHNAGRAKIEALSGLSRIHRARILRTWLYFENRSFFMDWIIAEIEAHKKKYTGKNEIFAARLNGTSDIPYERVNHYGETIFQIFPDVTFYDYTKYDSRDIDHVQNYSLTFSYTGHNHSEAINWLKAGKNVAIVFDTKRGEALPTMWNGFPVLDADITDYRPADSLGHVCGLRFKLGANEETNKEALNGAFVVKADSKACILDNSPALPF